MVKKWIMARLEERTTLDGAVMIAAGLAYLILGQTIATLAAYAAILYGAWTIWKKE
jgi:hypothetical protein